MGLTALELFAGIGGLSLGLERAGVEVVGQVELDPFCRAVLAKHWPEVPRHDDVRTALDWWTSESRPHVDIIAGGYPCQPESTAGRRRGTADERWLWPEFAAIVAALRPRYVLGENVMGHRTQGLRFVLADLDRLGYTVRAGVVSACEVGAPHSRARLFILANADGQQWRGGSDEIGSGTAPASPGREGQSVTQPRNSGGWDTTPGVRRMADGLPTRLDRRRALGNAVVPQVAQFVARLLLSGEWLADD